MKTYITTTQIIWAKGGEGARTDIPRDSVVPEEVPEDTIKEWLKSGLIVPLEEKEPEAVKPVTETVKPT